jgi:hypothetical protein
MKYMILHMGELWNVWGQIVKKIYKKSILTIDQLRNKANK